MTSSGSNTYNTDREQRIAEMDDGFLLPHPFHGKSDENPSWIVFKTFNKMDSV